MPRPSILNRAPLALCDILKFMFGNLLLSSVQTDMKSGILDANGWDKEN